MQRRELLIALLAVTTGILLVLSFLYKTPTPQPARKQRALPQREHQVRIDGLRFFSVRDGRKVLALEATSFALEKKKIGFLRIALAQTARIVNGKLLIFVEPDRKGPMGQPDRHRTGTAPGSEGPRDRASFPHLLSDATSLKDFPLPLGRVAAITVEPISVKIMEEERQLTSITAATAAIRLKSRDVLFQGNVRVASGNKALSTAELVFEPAKGSLKTDCAYLLTEGKSATAGERLQTDIFLQSWSPAP